MPCVVRQQRIEDGEQLAVTIGYKRVALQRMGEHKQPQERRRIAEH
jgi:hypothetical protein